MRITILGCGGSDGVPTIGGPDGRGDWGACDAANPKNRRTRASIFVETGASDVDPGERILIDTSPDCRSQLLAAGIGRVDAVLFTHDHADHSHGVHEMRRLARINGHALPAFADTATASSLRKRFSYAFDPEPGAPYPPIATLHAFAGAGAFMVGGQRVQAFPQDHGFGMVTTGFRIGDMAYTTDAVRLDEAAFSVLEGIRLWVVDCVQINRHPTHSWLAQTLAWIERVRPERAVLTHMGPQLDYAETAALCPPGVEPAYDGMIIELP